MNYNIKLLVSYDGTAFDGWQRGSKGCTIEEQLEKALGTICQHPITLQAASRTDAGVHASGQVVNFFTPHHLDLDNLIFRLYQLLPRDLVVLNAEYTTENFHPTLDALSKEYRYYICCGKVQSPHHRLYSWHVPYALDYAAMDRAMNLFCGKKDFRSFCNNKATIHKEDFVREIYSIERHEISHDRFYFQICGNNFLYRMVRTIVGTLIDVGRNKISIDQLQKIFEAKNRTQAGFCAPAHGLFLHQINYTQ